MASSCFILNVALPKLSATQVGPIVFAVQQIINACGKGEVTLRHVPNEEDTLVIAGQADVLLLDPLLDGLCEMLKQKCLAHWDCNTGVGRLYGPDTSGYEPFDEAKFLWAFDQASANNPGRILH